MVFVFGLTFSLYLLPKTHYIFRANLCLAMLTYDDCYLRISLCSPLVRTCDSKLIKKESILSALKSSTHRVSNVSIAYLLLILCLHHGCVDMSSTPHRQTLTALYNTIEHFYHCEQSVLRFIDRINAKLNKQTRCICVKRTWERVR